MGAQIENVRLTFLQNCIMVKKNYVLCLQKRLFYIREGFALLTETQKNKIEIEEYEISEKIHKYIYKIKKIERVFEKEFYQFSVDLKEVIENYNELLLIAKNKQIKSFNIKHFLYAVNWKKIDDNIEFKIEFYKQLKIILSLTNE